MIWHFLKMDIKRTWPIFVAASALFAIFFCVLGFSKSEWYQGYLFLYFVLGILCSQQIFGSRRRTQLSASRNYFLALPIDQKRLYLIGCLRAFVFMTPLLLNLALSPFLFDFLGKALSHFGPAMFFGAPLTVFVAAGAAMQSQTMQTERLFEFESSGMAFFMTILYGLVFGLQAILFGGIFIWNLVVFPHAAWLTILLVGVLGAGNYLYGRKLFVERRVNLWTHGSNTAS